MKYIFLPILIFFCFASNISAQDPWVMSTDSIVPKNYFGVSVANGMIGVVSSPEPLKVNNVILSGLYDKFGRGRVSNFISGFNLLNLKLYINGRAVTAENVSGMHQQLDMYHATFTTSFDFGKQASIKYTYCALRHLPYCILANMEITAKENLNITVVNMLQTPDALRNPQYTFNEVNRKHIGIQIMASQAKSPTEKFLLCAATSFAFTEARGEEPHVIHETPDNNLQQMKFSKEIKAGENYQFGLVGTTLSSVHSADPANEAERLVIFARLEGMKRLTEKHREAWSKLWNSDIRIEGDKQAQQDIHSMLYHLYSFASVGSGMSLSPMGLSGLGYNGHVFWDAETWMFPVLLILHPEMAENMLEYRLQRLQAARDNAYTHGYSGAMYPWESADSGVEETPIWALAGPFEHHISGCVALAAWQYYCVTQDVDWLQKKGWPILSETANFWVSRAEKNATGKYEIKNVVAADEYAENVDNDAFTNGVAKINLKNAAIAASLLGYPGKAIWKTVADNLLIEHFPDGTTREHSSYQGEAVKQADVNLLAYPLGIIKDTAQIHKDLKYYEIKIPEKNTPAMTQAIFSLLYARLGKKQKALHFFKDAYLPNLCPPFRVISETKGGDNPYFATGAGGVLQAVLMGFGGIEITPKGIATHPSVLPEKWKSLEITGVGKDKITIRKMQ